MDADPAAYPAVVGDRQSISAESALSSMRLAAYLPKL
jgi:hypothetical protein